MEVLMNQSDVLHLVIDVSGSMQEMGKLLLARNLVSFIREYLELQINTVTFSKIRLCTLNETIQLIELNKNTEIPKFNAKGKAELSSLQDYIKTELEQSTKVKVILFSDGNFNNKQLKDFCTWSQQHASLLLYSVIIGADANSNNLRQISNNQRAFSAEDISLAVQMMAQSVCDVIEPPTSALSFYFSEVMEEEDWG